MPTTKPLAKQDRAQLRQLEDVLTTARRWAAEEAKALLSIRDQRLYLLSHETFEEYGEQRWGFERAHLYRLVAWGEVLRATSPIGGAQPQRESHARPLYGLPDIQKREVWKAVITRLGGQRTAGEIAAVASDVLGRPKPQRAIVHGRRGTGIVVHGDAIEEVAKLAKGSIDLFMFSPPFCQQRSKHFPSIPEADFPRWLASLLEAMRPSLAPNGSIMVIGREHVRGGCITDAWLRARLAIRDLGYKEVDVLAWSKPDAPPLGRPDRPRRVYENIFWYSLSSSPYVDLRACSGPTTPATYVRRDKTTSGWHDNQPPIFTINKPPRVTDVIVAPVSANSTTGHSAAFPVKLADQLIRTYSPIGGKVADCCCGSGSSLVAARDAGRNFWGCDVMRRWVDFTRKRLKA